jgi:hypothetical protein
MRDRATDTPQPAYSGANETVARIVAYLSPYIFWATVCVITSGIWLLR